MSSVLSRRRGKAKEKKEEGTAEQIEEEARKIEKGIKKEAKKLVKAVERKDQKKQSARPARPGGRIPMAMVTSRHETGTVERPGRGFSFGELSQAGLARSLATDWGVRIDYRRRSVISGNVASLKGWTSKTSAAARAETEARKVGEELVEEAKEVEREAVIVEREAVKAGKEVRKEAKKAAEAVKKKVEKPKSRPKKKS